MASHIGRVHLRVGCVGVLCLLASLGGGPTTADSSRPVFSGQATAVQANVLNLQPITLADTGYFEAPEFLDYRELYPWLVWPALGLVLAEVGLAETVLRKLP